MTARALALGVGLALLAGCDPGPAKAAEPAWSKQACTHCMMLLSDKRFAAQATLATGERHYFDDVGCLVSWLERDGAGAKGAWVRTPTADGWIPAEAARFAPGAITPMDFGFAPAASGITFTELKQQLKDRSPTRGGAR
ncbi:MAG: hypothetical protein H6Q89_4974 [Myxococcaceae bacterium]|nr:hypothetical protein [Myxococcaceae bacterium]